MEAVSPVITRSSLSTRVADELRRRIVRCELVPGERLNEARLAPELGVSRTPLREALRALEREGLVDSEPAKGARVRALDSREIREVYELRSLLECQALRLAGLPSPDVLEQLDARNRKLTTTRTGAHWIERDEAWHRLLIQGCPNRRLLELIDELRDQTRRYEHAFVRAAGTLAPSLEQHDEILDALRAGRLERACALLAANMLVGLDDILEWLDAGDATQGAITNSRSTSSGSASAPTGNRTR